MKLKFEGCTVDVDTEATREYYQKNGKLNDCGCEYCENYRKFVPQLSEKVKVFFEECGLSDPRCFIELEPYTIENGIMLTSGIYYLVGSMEGGEPPKSMPDPLYSVRKVFARFFNKEAWQGMMDVEEIARSERYSKPYEIEDGFSVTFTNRHEFIQEDFPENNVQMRIMAKIPWILDEK